MKRKQAYVKGRRIENEARAVLEQAGWIVMRSAGSKGPFDLAAFGGFGTRLIQVKAKKATAADREGLALLAASLPRSISVELWERVSPKTFVMTVLKAPRKAV